MMQVIGDPARTFAHQIKDIYQLATYLRAGKYRYLRYAYFWLFAGIELGAVVQLLSLAV